MGDGADFVGLAGDAKRQDPSSRHALMGLAKERIDSDGDNR